TPIPTITIPSPLFFLSSSGDHPHLHSFPTRRSSDLFRLAVNYHPRGDQENAIAELTRGIREGEQHQVLLGVTGSGKTFTMAKVRSEEHTSELQSRFDLVCRLLLEKKKKHKKQKYSII